MATATMGVSSVDRLARSKRPVVERTEIHIPPAPTFPVEAVTGDPARRVQAVASFNNALQKWRNDAWSIEAPFVPDAELQADVATLEDTTAKMSTKLDRASIDIRIIGENITEIETNITNIDNSITTINNAITVIDGNAITGSGIVQANGAGPPTSITGSTGHFPYWQPASPFLSPSSPIWTDGTNVGIGTVAPVATLHVTTADAITAAITTVLRVEHKITGGGFMAVNGGTAIVWAGASDSAVDRDMASVSTRWVTATDASRGAALDFNTGTAGGALTTRMSVLDTGRIAIGTLTSPSAMATFVSAINPTSAGISGILNTVTITPTASTGNGAQGFQSASTLAGTFRSGSSTSILGSISVTNTSASNGNTVGVTGVKGSASTSGSGQATNLSALEAIWTNASTGTVTSFYGLRINSIVANAGIITNTYGIHIGDVTLGTQTNNAYSIFASDANAWCYFAGRVGIGTTLPGVMLDLGLAGTTLGVMRLAGNTSGNVTIQPAAIAGTWTLTLPVNDGALGEFLTTDGGGITSWASVAPTYAFTEGSVIFAGAGGTSLAEDNANLFYNDTLNALGIGINTFVLNQKLRVSSAAPLTTSQSLVSLDNNATSSTASINKYGLFVTTQGTWNGATSQVTGVASVVNGGTSTATGLYGECSGNAIFIYGVDGLAGATSAGVTNSVGVRGFSVNSSAPTFATGGLFSATGGLENFGVYIAAGKLKQASVDGVICASGALATSATAGFLYIPTCAGSPTGVPVTETGTVAKLFNTTSNKLGIYDAKWFQFSPYEVKTYDVADTGNVGIGEDTLRTYTIPGNTLSDNGDSIEFYAGGTFATSINSKRLRVKFGATTIFDSGALAITSAADWSLEGSIIRTGAATQRAIVRLTTSSGTLAAYADYTTPGETLSGTVDLVITGEATSNDDIVATIFKCMYLGTA